MCFFICFIGHQCIYSGIYLIYLLLLVKLAAKKTVDHTNGYFNELAELNGISYPSSRYLLSSLLILLYFLL